LFLKRANGEKKKKKERKKKNETQLILQYEVCEAQTQVKPKGI